MGKVTKTDDQWREELDSDVYEITREAATERPFSGKYCDTKTPGVYNCTCCGAALFDSDTKYDSGSGWPSFYTPISSEVVSTKEDNGMAMQRVEVMCAQCDSHLGHVFPDGPQPTGLRYCLNSASLDLKEKAE
ncbi:MAG: peptide-methionine (R)-S-oxide reductase MsrB [Gammaproteobacteria bacterium]|nr:peptide-methionine (R)-S-oxide reductase MsrB [Gammaproteobacteria bacterium]